ncbi:GIY-YIG nuclease family protein [Candidatus Pelagibacter sp. HIMB1485]|uniref:GIY-YIG nuclease family protein n=1 Tax=Candidatus Pelagibacter sp. HIMB1485 TaxID=3415415 RepID=UPI003F84CF07
MSFYVYLLISTNTKIPLTYVGYTNNLKKRLISHNNSTGAKFTRGRKWKIIYKCKYINRSIAMSEEYKLKKNYNLRNQLKNKYLKK